MNRKETTAVLVRKRANGFLTEFLLVLLVLLSSSFLNAFLYACSPFEDGRILEVVYSENMSFTIETGLLYFSIMVSGVTLLFSYFLYFLLRPSGLSPAYGKGGKNILSLFILSLFGLLAHVVLMTILSGFGISPLFSSFVVSFICSFYYYLLYKLYMEERTFSNNLFWEIFRFAIVGLVAAVFDFSVCYLVQFQAFSGNQAVYVTILATACGFLVGVVINYLMSTFMVYKNAKTNTSKTGKGMVIFFLLSTVGLLIGIGIQAFLYDFLFLQKEIHFLSYPVDFVIRTLIVMVYNYVTRKVFIYR